MAVSKVDAANQIENQLPQANIAGNVNFRNIIINGDMSIAQRGTSESGITSTNYYTIDRMRFVDVSLGTFTMSQDTDVPTGQGFAKSLKVDCTTADAAPDAGDVLQIQTRFEGQNVQYLKKGTANAQSLTASFWVKSNKTGTYIAELRDIDNSRHISKSYTIDASNTWEKKTITYPGDTTGTLDNDNNVSFDIQFWLGSGNTYTSGTLQTTWGAIVNANRAVGQVNLADSDSNEFYITGIQLEAGTTASDFEFLPHDVNLQRCARYYQIVQEADGTADIICNGAMYASQVFYGNLYLGTKMRATPSVSAETGTNAYQVVGNGSNGNSTGPDEITNIANNCSLPHVRVRVSNSISLGQGNAAWLRFGSASTTQKITAAAEL